MRDADGVITYVNPAFTRAYGFQPSELVGQTGAVLGSGMQSPSFFDAIWATVRSNQVWTGTIVNRRKDGSLIETELVISAIQERDGRFAGYVQADRDVTRERELERALERDARERDAVQTALAQIDATRTVEEIASAACEVITALPGVDSTMALALGDVEGTVLAISGPLSAVFVPGMSISSARVADLRERGSGGPWFEEWRPSPDAGPVGEAISAAGLLSTVYAPLRDPSGVIGVVGIASHDPATAPRSSSTCRPLPHSHRRLGPSSDPSSRIGDKMPKTIRRSRLFSTHPPSRRSSSRSSTSTRARSLATRHSVGSPTVSRLTSGSLPRSGRDSTRSWSSPRCAPPSPQLRSLFRPRHS